MPALPTLGNKWAKMIFFIWRILFSVFGGYLFLRVLLMRREDLTRWIEPLAYLDIDPELRKVPAWEILRVFFLVMVAAALAVVWIVPAGSGGI